MRRFLFLSLYLVIIISGGEVYSLISGEIVNHTQVTTPLWLKLAKDLIMWLAIFYFFANKRIRLNNSVTQVIWWGLLVSVILSVSFSILSGESLMMIAAGMRWVAPILLFIGAVGNVTHADIAYMAKVIRNLFYAHFTLQLIELFYASSYFGLTFWGLNLRNPGAFVIPNTGGLFTVLAAYFYLNFSEEKPTWGNRILFLVSAYLTASGTAIVTLLIVYYIHATYKFRSIWVPLAPAGAALFGWLMYVSLEYMRGDGYVNASLGTRLGIISTQVFNTELISESFGTATNTAVLLKMDSSRIVDSTYASVLANIGWLGFFFLLMAVIYAFYISEKYKSSSLFSLLCFCLLAAFTTVLNEAYPFNFILPVLFAYYFSMRFTQTKC